MSWKGIKWFGILNPRQRYVLLNALEESNYFELIESLKFQSGFFKYKDKNKFNYNEWKCECEKDDLCDYCGEITEGVFDNLGWVGQDSHYVIGIKKPSVMLYEFVFEIRYRLRHIKRKLKNRCKCGWSTYDKCILHQWKVYRGKRGKDGIRRTFR